MTQKYTREVLIYGIPSVVDSSVYGAFGELLFMPTFNKHVATNNKNKQVLILRKPVLGSLLFKSNSLHITLYFEDDLCITVTYYLETKVTIIY